MPISQKFGYRKQRERLFENSWPSPIAKPTKKKKIAMMTLRRQLDMPENSQNLLRSGGHEERPFLVPLKRKSSKTNENSVKKNIKPSVNAKAEQMY